MDTPIPDPFAPAPLGPLTLRNRIIKAATFEGVVPEALVTEELIDFHRRPAAGGVGMTTVAYLAVSPEGRTHAECIWLRPEAVPGLARLAEVVHGEGAKVSAQIGHAGPVANAKSNRATSLSPSRSFNPVSMKVTKAATEDDITRITLDYERGARYVAEAGFDAIEIHLAHNYLLSSFLCPRVNKRKDQWSGSLENRARFARQVVRSVREAVGPSMAVTAKVSLDDGVPGGFKAPESAEFAAPARGRRRTSTRSSSPAAARWPTPCTCSAATPLGRTSPPRFRLCTGSASSSSARR